METVMLEKTIIKPPGSVERHTWDRSLVSFYVFSVWIGPFPEPKNGVSWTSFWPAGKAKPHGVFRTKPVVPIGQTGPTPLTSASFVRCRRCLRRASGGHASARPRLGGLLALGFGEAGAEVIGQNMKA